ncbi:serine protease grass-like [Drosophila ficusphila]|uniref:serine protease grass-like n=1 Tax=Drosophila ficusphila TaxID=30025 RepID=UPI0007E6D42E|nr:serine protease grass-like [Drosophila ficusphila]
MNTIAVGITFLIFPLLGSAQFIDPACGIRAANPYSFRVANGTIAELTSSPWMAFLHTTQNIFVCGGSLISQRLVLTAAHCLYPKKELIARLGEYDREDYEHCHGSYCNFRIEAKVAKAIHHRFYDPKTLSSDIAILQLFNRVQYTDSIRPICIPWNTKWRHYIDRLDPLTGTGWGTTESERDSAILRTVDLNRQPPDVCLMYTNAILSTDQFCAGNWESNLCNGDSGGPLGALVPYGKSKRFVQVGIASFTNKKCSKASVFTDVLSFADWIVKVHSFYN